ncbi:MAG: DUF1269 domain-containing protein [Chloroflexi bacterium]|nr:DUF1269 domain-containing protein [Chloroflexota bacterium]
MSNKEDYNLVIAAFEGKETADFVYNTLLAMQNAMMVELKTVSTVYRNDRGKLKVHHKHGLTTWKGAAGGIAVGLLLGGPILGGAIGALIGSRGDGEQRKAKKFLDEKLGEDNSAIIVAFKEANLTALRDMFDRFNAEQLLMALTPETEKEIADLAANEEVAQTVQAEIDIIDESSVA